MKFKDIPNFILLIGMGVLGLWFAFNPWSIWPSGKERFDALAALFTGLAFVGLLWTLHLQKKDIDQTRNVLLKTAEANQLTAKMAIINTRVQFLFFWLKENKARYEEMRSYNIDELAAGIRESLSETHRNFSGCMVNMVDPSWGKASDMLNPKTISNVAHIKFIKKYSDLEKELFDLTGFKLEQLLEESDRKQGR